MWKKSKKLRSSALAILLAASMTVGMVPGGMGQVQAADGKAKAEEEVGFLDKAKGFFSGVGDGIADFFAGDKAEAEPAAALDEASIVDGDTSQSWTDVVEYNTQNIGRIWTDKSVYKEDVKLTGIEGGADIPITKPEDSDFMVGLSALSSTSNTSVTTQTPLDIVLVLDMSGSMSQNMTNYSYTATYNVNPNSNTTYYAQRENGTYVQVDKIMTGWIIQRFDHWEVDGQEVEPKNSANDMNQDHVQFYTRRQAGQTNKLAALKTAVNGFIDATAVQNEKITDESKQHHISIVKYAGTNSNDVGDDTYQEGWNIYNYSQIVTNLTGDMDALGRTIDGLESGGATSADYGMQHANNVLNPDEGHGARANAQKVVVMFTDGEPNHQSGFDGAVANATITSAKTLKDAGALVYTIGVVSGADPSDIDNEINGYLNGVSSNYPDATGYTRRTLGDRDPEGNFYKAATSSEDLNSIFQEISQEINTGTGYPTETPEGFENRDGYVTFHDQLGDYMQVDSFNTLVLEDQTFTAEKSEEGGVIKYTYSGNAGEGKDVSNIVIEVTPGTGSAGDTIDVSIPAALLPLRHFQVDISENTMKVTNKYPLRLFYNASLRDEAKEALANPDQDMKNYIAANSKDGEVYFYSNKYTGSKQGPSENKTLGDTVATFEPATGNSFYYFTENTPLWADPEGNIPVKEYNANQEQYYYKKTYYKVDNNTTSGAPEEVTEVVSFRSHPRDEVEDWVGTATDGQLYIKAGAPRLTRIHDLTLGKKTNETGTATEVITPNWDDETNQTNIEVSLGNNGCLAVELPGTLEIKKTVTSDVTAPEKDFNFKLYVTDAENNPLTGTFDAQKFDAQGNVSGEAFTVQNESEITLKHGESVQVYGLSNGDRYIIEETEIPAGFSTPTNPMEGTIVGNQITTAEFVNTYAVEPLIIGANDAIRGQKVLEGRDWKDTDSFAIRLTSRAGAPLPEADEEGETVEGNIFTKVVKNADEFSFGSITFDRPGKYVYTVSELSSLPGSNEGILGIHYSKGMYRVEVDVDDNGDGKLSAKITMTQTMSDDGEYIANPEALESPVAEFTNVYDAEDAQWAPRGRKVYTDHSGAKPLDAQMFHFQVEAEIDENHTEAGPLPKSAENGKYTTSHSVNGDIVFEQLTFGSELVGKSYLYKITEKNEAVQGMTYDDTVYYLEVTIGAEGEGADAITTVTSKYLDADKQELPDVNEVVFENSYTPTPVIIGTNTLAGIAGTKTLIGRDMNENEFSFELTANNQAAIAGLADDSIVFESENTKDSMTATAPAAKKDTPADFAFGSIQFTKPGEYTFNMKEVKPEQDGQGLTCDRHTEVVTVKVTDNDGVLEAAVSYDADGAAFENIYTASHSYGDDGGVVVTKTMNGRRMSAGEFDFTITGTGENADKANEKLADADKSFQNVAARADRKTEMPKLRNVQFTQEDAGETFTYLIDEVMPEDDKKAGGVTYDQSEYTLAITVTDNGNGTMSTSSVVTRTKAKDGTEVKETLDAQEVPFVNEYKAGEVSVNTTADARLRKQLNGRAWAANESFSFTMSPVANGEGEVPPMPVADPDNGIVADESGNLVATVRADKGTPSGTDVHFGFGSITYEEAGTYVYTVKENVPDPKAGGMTYSTNEVTITVTVTDPGTGTLEATLTAVGSEGTRRFINNYDASLNLGAAGGLAITKTLNGHALAAEQFTFKIEAVTDDKEGTATVEEAAALFGFNKGETEVTFKNPEAAADGDTVTMLKQDTEFTLENLGKTYKYKVSEVIPEDVDENQKKDGYTYDDTVHNLELWVTDDGDGTLTLYAKVDDTEVTKDETTANSPIIIGFNNTYEATGDLEGAANLVVTKNLAGRDWIESDSFSFKLEAAEEYEGVTLPDNASELVIDDETTDHKAAFGDITFTKPGTYTFKVSEVVPEGAVQNEDGTYTLNGITYDANLERTITVKVTEEDTENGNGKLVATVVEEESDDLTFTNTYGATGVVLPADKQFEVEKTLTGRDWKDGETFTFTLTGKDNAPTPTDGNTVTVTKDTAGTFGTISYDQAGTYEYTITENVPDGVTTDSPTKDGITYDLHEETVTVVVTDNFAGKLEIESVTYSGKGESAQFTNTYSATTGEDVDVAASIEATKTLTGRDMDAGEFQFKVVTSTGTLVAEGTNEAAANDVAGAVNFAGRDGNGSVNLKYTTESLAAAVEAGYATKEGNVWTVNYTAEEKTDKDNLPKGVMGGNILFNFSIKVTDNLDGTLTAEVQYPEGGIAFTNTYSTGGTTVDTDPTEANAYFNKVLTGRDWIESDEFTFTITPQDGAPAPEGAEEDGTKTVTVTSENAKAGTSVSFGFGKIAFTDKDMTGATANADGTLSKTFTYNVSEVVPETKIPGINYDTHVATLTITVTDNQQGDLSATASVTATNGTFTNEYTSALDYTALGGLQITKVLHGRDMEAEQFTFTVKPQDDESAAKLGEKELKNKAADAEAVDTIDVLDGTNVTFTQADAGKTFTYEVAETKGDNAAYTYDEKPATVTIKVEDNTDATLTVTTTVTKDGNDVDTQIVTTGQPGQKATVPFENTYNDVPVSLGGEGNVSIEATKSLTNRPMVDGEFTFNVLDKNGDKVTTGTNDANGTITFKPVEYTTDKLMADVKEGLATVDKENAPTYVYTYDYAVAEDTTDLDNGVTPITKNPFKIQVVVTDEGNGTLTINVVYPEGKDSLAFENAYGTSANAEVNVNGQKELKVESGDNAPDITGKYTFTIEGSKGAPMPEKTEVTNDEAGNVDFGKIFFTMENVFGDDATAEEPETPETEDTESEVPEAESETTDEVTGETVEEVDATGAAPADESDQVMPISEPREKTFTYTVTESGNVPGVTNDPQTTRTLTVTVTDKGDGTISVTGPEAFTFTNTYRVAPIEGYNIGADITIKKELSGRKMADGEFTFELVNSDNEVVATATNDADGNVTFVDTLEFAEPGYYNYVIREQQGTKGGVQYDSTEHTVTVLVTDNGNGTLSAKAETKSKAEIVFKNIYETTPASATLGASKVYEGAELKDEQFTFQLKDKDGKVVSEAKNTKEGRVAFETITYDEAGTYEYTISEKNDKQKDVIYDETVYAVTVTVTDNGEGSLLAEVVYKDGKAPVFKNKYTKPAEPTEPTKPEEPKKPAAVKTGDTAPVVGLVVMMVAAFAVIAAVTVMFFRRRRR